MLVERGDAEERSTGWGPFLGEARRRGSLLEFGCQRVIAAMWPAPSSGREARTGQELAHLGVVGSPRVDVVDLTRRR